MSTHKSVIVNSFEEASPSMNIEQVIRLAEASIKNGNSSLDEQDDAIKEAQAAGVTNCEYVRARLLLRLIGNDTHRVKELLKE